MSTANPLGKRPFSAILAGDFDFPGAPVPRRLAPEWAGLSGAAQKELLQPDVTVVQLASPWDAPSSTMTLADGTGVSTQTVLPTTDTTPQLTSAVPGGTAVSQSWFSQQNLVPGLSNMEVLGLAIAIMGVGFALAGKH